MFNFGPKYKKFDPTKSELNNLTDTRPYTLYYLTYQLNNFLSKKVGGYVTNNFPEKKPGWSKLGYRVHFGRHLKYHIGTQLHTYNHGGSMYEFSFLYENIRRGLPYKDDEKQEKYLGKAHCSLLDIYISQKTKLCVVNLEDQFQMSLEAKLINFLIWKFKSIILIFLLFFAVVVKSGAFCTLLLLFQRVEVIKLQFDTKTWLKQFNLFEIALTVSKKHWIWQFLQKIEEKLE